MLKVFFKIVIGQFQFLVMVLKSPFWLYPICMGGPNRAPKNLYFYIFMSGYFSISQILPDKGTYIMELFRTMHKVF